MKTPVLTTTFRRGAFQLMLAASIAAMPVAVAEANGGAIAYGGGHEIEVAGQGLSDRSKGPSVPTSGNAGQEETSVQTPCGGDFGLLGNVEAEQVAPANPMNAPVCE